MPPALRPRDPAPEPPTAPPPDQLLAAIVQNSDDAIASKTLDGLVTSWNPAAERLFGYAAEEILGRPMTTVFPEDRLAEEDRILAQIVAGERVAPFETVRRRKDGTLVHVSVTVSPVRDGAGRVVGASKIVRDITAQKAARAREQLVATVFSHAREAIVITDAAGLLVDVNEAFTRITGFAREEVLGRDPSMFRSARQGPEAYRALERDLHEQGHCQGEVWSRRKDGVAYAGLLTVSRVADEAGVIHHYVAIFADITAIKQHQDALAHLAHHDPLTGLPNRLLLSDRLDQAIASSRRTSRPFAVLYLDLDGFKLVNDEHGHDVGDELLIGVAAHLRACIRSADTLARIGGDEFVVILTDLDGDECEPLVGRILAACFAPVTVRNLALRVSASVGYTVYPYDDVDPDRLVRHADSALYEAKQQGRNRYQRFDAARYAEVRTRTSLVTQVAAALRWGELVLHYQPKVNLRTGAVLGVEALVRWNHPQRGLVPPGAFLPHLAGTPVAWELDDWTLRTALAQAAAWQREGLALPVSVNVSAGGLQRPAFVQRLAHLLGTFPTVRPDHVELEIVETTSIDDVNAAAWILEQCHALGVRFAVDDFGTGYSSLTYLRRLPAETLKIDQSFVRDMLRDENDLAIVRGVVGLARAFGRDVVAEGVETVESGLALLALGCTAAQGYVIAPPMEGAAIGPWIARWRPPEAWRAAPPPG